jgi:hypothetical protein
MVLKDKGNPGFDYFRHLQAQKKKIWDTFKKKLLWANQVANQAIKLIRSIN